MKSVNKFRFFSNSIILMVFSLALFLPGYAAAADNAIVSISISVDNIDPGEQFTVNINIEPNNEIAGVQFDLSFNPEMVTVNDIVEGNLLKQDGANTFFYAGTIDNQSGTITGVFGAIITPGQTVSSGGIIATITMTADTREGNCPIILSNVVVGDATSQLVSSSIVNDTITIGEPSGDTSPGGGGGGGGGARGVTTFSSTITPEGKLVSDITAVSSDLQLYLKLSSGTYCNLGDGAIYWLSIIASEENDVVPDPPEGWIPVTPAYKMEPEGAVFSPSGICTFKYGPWSLPDGLPENKITIMYWDPVVVQWVALETEVDTIEKLAIASIGHFSLYQAMAPNRPASFSITEFSATPQEIEPGSEVNINATVTNTGDLTGSYEVILLIDGSILDTRQVTLEGGVSQTFLFNTTSDTPGTHEACIGDCVVTFDVKESLAPVNITTSNLNLSTTTVNPGGNVEIDVIVSNTGALHRNYNLALKLDGAIVETQEVLLEGGESTTVHFNITLNDLGEHTIAINGLQAICEVIEPAEHAVENTPMTEAEIERFDMIPVYDEDTGKLTSARFDYQVNISNEPVSETELTLSVFFNGELLEQIRLLSLSQLRAGSNSGSIGYVPTLGWASGTYTFEAGLNSGDANIYNTDAGPLTVTPEHMTGVVSWKTLGIVIASTLVLLVLIVALVLYRRREMFRDYFH